MQALKRTNASSGGSHSTTRRCLSPVFAQAPGTNPTTSSLAWKTLSGFRRYQVEQGATGKANSVHLRHYGCSRTAG
jgi:hypothetical protein